MVEKNRAPFTRRDFQTAADADQEAAERRWQENERFKKQWMQRHPTESVARRLLNRFLRFLSAL